MCLLAGSVVALVLGIIVGLAVSGLAGVVAFVVVTVGVAGAVTWLSWRIALRYMRARPLGSEEAPRLANLVEGLCATFGLAVPTLMIVDDGVPNSCSVAGAGREVLVVTSGLLDRLDLVELEGVVAHELAHIKGGDARVSAVAVAVVSPFGWATGRSDLLHSVLGEGREYQSDCVAASAVRYPPGLQRALETLQSGPPPTSSSIFSGRRLILTQWLWIHPVVAQNTPGPGAGPGSDPGAKAERQDLDAASVRALALAEL